jgi:hypothetical protein
VRVTTVCHSRVATRFLCQVKRPLFRKAFKIGKHAAPPGLIDARYPPKSIARKSDELVKSHLSEGLVKGSRSRLANLEK